MLRVGDSFGVTDTDSSQPPIAKLSDCSFAADKEAFGVSSAT